MNYDDSNWREESLPYYTGLQADLLRDGPKSLAQSWMMQAMKNEWKKRNGYKDPEPPDCSSNIGEFFEKQKKYEKYEPTQPIYDEINDPFGGR
tara:strand:- start:390 stop:668 length:279 start_codon:yes stop_codon:yes gene_type:complete